MKFDYIYIIIFRKVNITSIFSFLVCKKYKLSSHFINLIVKFWRNMYFEKCSHIIQMYNIAECHVLTEHLMYSRSRLYMDPNSEDKASAFRLKIKTEREEWGGHISKNNYYGASKSVWKFRELVVLNQERQLYGIMALPSRVSHKIQERHGIYNVWMPNIILWSAGHTLVIMKLFSGEMGYCLIILINFF